MTATTDEALHLDAPDPVLEETVVEAAVDNTVQTTVQLVVPERDTRVEVDRADTASFSTSHASFSTTLLHQASSESMAQVDVTVEEPFDSDATTPPELVYAPSATEPEVELVLESQHPGDVLADRLEEIDQSNQSQYVEVSNASFSTSALATATTESFNSAEVTRATDSDTTFDVHQRIGYVMVHVDDPTGSDEVATPSSPSHASSVEAADEPSVPEAPEIVVTAVSHGEAVVDERAELEEAAHAFTASGHSFGTIGADNDSRDFEVYGIETPPREADTRADEPSGTVDASESVSQTVVSHIGDLGATVQVVQEVSIGEQVGITEVATHTVTLLPVTEAIRNTDLVIPQSVTEIVVESANVTDSSTYEAHQQTTSVSTSSAVLNTVTVEEVENHDADIKSQETQATVIVVQPIIPAGVPIWGPQSGRAPGADTRDLARSVAPPTIPSIFDLPSAAQPSHEGSMIPPVVAEVIETVIDTIIDALPTHSAGTGHVAAELPHAPSVDVGPAAPTSVDSVAESLETSQTITTIGKQVTQVVQEASSSSSVDIKDTAVATTSGLHRDEVDAGDAEDAVAAPRDAPPQPILRIFEESLGEGEDIVEETVEEIVVFVPRGHGHVHVPAEAAVGSHHDRSVSVHDHERAAQSSRTTLTADVVHAEPVHHDHDELPERHKTIFTPAPRATSSSAGLTCGCSVGRKIEVPIIHTAPPLVTFAINFNSHLSHPRAVVLAVVNGDSCEDGDLEVIPWKIVEIPVGPFSDYYEFSGEFGLAVYKGRSTYTSRSVNRIGSLTRITNRGSTVLIQNPEYACGNGLKQMRVRNDSDEPLDVAIGVVSCSKAFEPLLRHRELPCDEEVSINFRSLNLQMFFIPSGTTECSFETGQFGAIPLDSFTASKRNIVTVDLQEKGGRFRVLVQ